MDNENKQCPYYEKLSGMCNLAKALGKILACREWRDEHCTPGKGARYSTKPAISREAI